MAHQHSNHLHETKFTREVQRRFTELCTQHANISVNCEGTRCRTGNRCDGLGVTETIKMYINQFYFCAISAYICAILINRLIKMPKNSKTKAHGYKANIITTGKAPTFNPKLKCESVTVHILNGTSAQPNLKQKLPCVQHAGVVISEVVVTANHLTDTDSKTIQKYTN